MNISIFQLYLEESIRKGVIRIQRDEGKLIKCKGFPKLSKTEGKEADQRDLTYTVMKKLKSWIFVGVFIVQKIDIKNDTRCWFLKAQAFLWVVQLVKQKIEEKTSKNLRKISISQTGGSFIILIQ